MSAFFYLLKKPFFRQAFCLGFSVEDAMALLRLDELYLDTFDITDGT